MLASGRGRAPNLAALRPTQPGENPMSKTSSNQKVRYAVVGLGHLSQTAVLPAFEHTENAELYALVSRDEAKRSRLARRYGVEVMGGRDELERVLAESRADAVYITS